MGSWETIIREKKQLICEYEWWWWMDMKDGRRTEKKVYYLWRYTVLKINIKNRNIFFTNLI